MDVAGVVNFEEEVDPGPLPDEVLEQVDRLDRQVVVGVNEGLCRGRP